MPFCGFNQKMLEGLIAFHEGLVEHGIIERSRLRGQSVNQTIERELSDMERFLGETERIADPEVRKTVETLTKYAHAFYSLIRKKGFKNYKQTIQGLNRLYVEMDDKFYKDLEGKPNDMVQLVEHLNRVEVK